jgi:methionine synthase II (cobalamin-independent)
MYAQFSEGFPGVVLTEDKIYVDRGRDLDQALERLYIAYLQNDVDGYAVSPEYAAGLYAMLSQDGKGVVAVKGQITGPVSWGLSVADQNRRPVLYDQVLADALAKHLRLRAAWQEKILRSLSPNTIIFVDEPYMSSFGSAYVSLSRELVISLLNEVFQGLAGLKGVHCCGNTDWSILLQTPINILNFDAYNYAESLSLYPQEVRAFLDRGGIIAWGIVPNETKALAGETADSLLARLEEAMSLLTKKGISREILVQRCMVTPSCGLASLSPRQAAQALRLTKEVSNRMRRKYPGAAA